MSEVSLAAPEPDPELTSAGKEFLTDQERREALQHLAPARRRLLSLLLHPGVTNALRLLSETWLGGRLLYEWVLKPLSLNSLNVRPTASLRHASWCYHRAAPAERDLAWGALTL